MKGTRDVDRRLERLLAQYATPPAERVHSGIERVRGRLRSGVLDDTVDESTVTGLATRRVRSRVLVLAAAAVLFLAGAGILTRTLLVTEGGAPAVVEAGESSLYLLSGGQMRPLQPNERVAFGEIVRSNGGAGGMLRLADGSRVEVRSQSELTFQRADDGVRIRLGTGGIIVNAAKRLSGHLYVQTKDVTVSVVGTVFLVNAEEQGSRVAVIEGEVRVQQGATEKKLLPGEHVTTTPLMPSRPVIEELAWSRNAEEHVLLLRQSVVLERSPAPSVATAAQNRADVSRVFEVASVRPSDATGPGGRGGPVGSHNTGPCTNGASQIDPRRFVAPNNTLYTLITLAYGMGSCLSTVDRLSGGPGWIRSDRFDVEALIPKGAPSYTAQQFHRGEAPVLQAMLRTLLAGRFKLAVHRETKEGPVYLLELEKGAQKLTPWKEGVRGPANAAGTRAIMAAPGYVEGQKASMADLANQLTMVTGRPVLDRTGVAGEFNYSFQFAPLDSTFFTVAPNPAAALRPSLFTVLGERLGLKLQDARAPVEVLVIDAAERPTEN